MDLIKVNKLLSTAILSFTEREIEEAVAVGSKSSYTVPRPTKKGMPSKKRGRKPGSKNKSPSVKINHSKRIVMAAIKDIKGDFSVKNKQFPKLNSTNAAGKGQISPWISVIAHIEKDNKVFIEVGMSVMEKNGDRNLAEENFDVNWDGNVKSLDLIGEKIATLLNHHLRVIRSRKEKPKPISKQQEEENVLYDLHRKELRKKRTIKEKFIEKYGKDLFARLVKKDFITTEPRDLWVEVFLTMKGKMNVPTEHHTEYFGGY